MPQWAYDVLWYPVFTETIGTAIGTLIAVSVGMWLRGKMK